ncbi:hypothetical protein [Massilia sp. Leaf139]|uniref:hypothetical protein n=1 Tax=Massilia sp. Leaf139 TaxID=1736272 RepID=UPI0012E70A94|nr:hypothetical protein [Massilia sp. Leaf139]
MIRLAQLGVCPTGDGATELAVSNRPVARCRADAQGRGDELIRHLGGGKRPAGPGAVRGDHGQGLRVAQVESIETAVAAVEFGIDGDAGLAIGAQVADRDDSGAGRDGAEQGGATGCGSDQVLKGWDMSPRKWKFTKSNFRARCETLLGLFVNSMSWRKTTLPQHAFPFLTVSFFDRCLGRVGLACAITNPESAQKSILLQLYFDISGNVENIALT